MRNLVFLIILILIISCSEVNCEGIKTGTFLTENEYTGGTILVRTAKTQEEINEKLGTHLKYDLLWKDECSYALFNGTLLKGNNFEIEGKKTDTVFVEIIELIPNGYKFRASSNFSDFINLGKVKRKQ